MGVLKVNLDQPRYDQSTYWGRVQHFFAITNPLNILVPDSQLDCAKNLVETYKQKKTVPDGVTEEDLWRAKNVYDSAFHPDTGEKMLLIGRMSAQVPMNMVITGCMMTFYKSTPAVIFWQWFNQSFNAVVNYTNRSGKNPISTDQLATSYALATTGAVGTALTLNRLAKRAPPVLGRFVPFAAVAAANCINIPMMRRSELKEGLMLSDADQKELGLKSRLAAKQAIVQVAASRILIAVPNMTLTPLLAAALEARGLPAGAIVQTLFCGFCLTFATPMCCALFSQRAPISVGRLEEPLKVQIKSMKNPPDVVYYNKGL